MSEELRAQIAKFVEEYREIYRVMYAHHYPGTLHPQTVIYDENPGPSTKFLALWQGHDGKKESAICFIALVDGESKAVGPYKAGDILKVATWKAPAKGVRGSIFNADMFEGAGNFRENKSTPSWYK